MQVSLLGVPPDGTVVLIDAGNSLSINSVTSSGAGASIVKSFVNGTIVLKSLIATSPLAIANNTNDLTFSIDLSAYVTNSALTTTLAGYVQTTRTISTTAPLAGGGVLSSNLTLSIPVANGSANGYLSSADWTTFNGKQAALGFTPVAPTRSLIAGNGLSGGGDLSADRTFDVNVDNSTIEISSDTLRVKDGGITTAKLSVGSVVQSPDAVQLYTKVLTIGDWNMDTTATASVSHGLASYKKIRSISVIIRDDADSAYSQLSESTAGVAVDGGLIQPAFSTVIILQRITTGYFDNTNYDSTSYNRGWVTILYEA